MIALGVLGPTAGIYAKAQSQIAADTQTVPGPRDAHIARTLPYAGNSADPLTLDIYNGIGPAPHPVVLIVHGGGFAFGTP